MHTRHLNISQFFREADIEGFIRDGAPNDEYDAEALNIETALAKLTPHQFSQNEIETIIALTWAKSFELTGQELELRMPAIRQVAQRIAEMQE